MGARGPLPKKKALRVLSGKLPLTKENLQDGLVEMVPPDPPADLSKAEQEIWDRTVELLRPLRVLEKIDGAVLAAYCSSYVRWREAERQLQNDTLLIPGASGATVGNPLVSISKHAAAAMVEYARELGMTPAARMRVTVLKDKPPDNAFQKLKKVRHGKFNMGKKGGRLREVGDAQGEQA